MIRLCVILILAAGIALTVYSEKLPYYSNLLLKEKVEEETNDKILSDPNRKDIEKAEENYYQSVEKLKTQKANYFDLGSGIVVASIVIIAFLLKFRIRRLADLKNLKSVNKSWLYLISIPVWLLLIPGAYWYYTLRAERGDYPMFADSIAIPIFYSFIVVAIGFLLFLPFLVISISKSQLPTFIFIKPEKYDSISIVRESFWGILLLIDLASLISFIIDGDHVSIIVTLYFVYLLLTLRAGITNKYNESLYPIENNQVTV